MAIHLLASSKNELKAFMKDFPDIKSLYCRNDNATSYSGAAVLMAKKGVCGKLGIRLESLDFNKCRKGMISATEMVL